MCSVLPRNSFNLGRFLYKSLDVVSHKGISLPRINFKKSYCTDDKFKTIKQETQHENEEHNLAAGIKTEYQVFRDEDADVIFDVEEEQKRLNLETINELQKTADPYDGLNMNHGVEGVFDIGDLVKLLRNDKAQNIFVAKVPPELSYVDYIVIVTGRSKRHMSALATYIRKAYKLKKYKEESIPKIEGEKSNDWLAIDLGNIALHVLSTEAREKYDLETLWSVGPNYDRLTNSTDSNNEFHDRYTEYLDKFQPAAELASISKSM